MTTETNCADTVCKDEAARRDKTKVLNKTWWNSLFFSMTDSMQYIAGLLTAVGMATAVKPFADALGAGGNLGAAFSSIPLIGGVFLAGAALMTAAAIGFGFASSRVHHENTFDQMEVNAQHVSKYTAKALVKELKEELTAAQARPPQNVHQVVFNNQNAVRADGKTWVQVKQEENTVSLQR